MLNAAQQSCAAFGFSPGTPEFANCVQTDYYNRQARLESISNNLRAAGQQTQQPYAAPTESYSHNAGPMANLVSQSVRGTSRLCVYNRMNSPYVITLNVTDICPITAP